MLVIALFVLGPKRLPEAGRTAGRGIKEFKDAFAGVDGARSSTAAAPPRADSPRTRYIPPRPPAARRGRSIPTSTCRTRSSRPSARASNPASAGLGGRATTGTIGVRGAERVRLVTKFWRRVGVAVTVALAVSRLSLTVASVAAARSAIPGRSPPNLPGRRPPSMP